MGFTWCLKNGPDFLDGGVARGLFGVQKVPHNFVVMGALREVFFWRRIMVLFLPISRHKQVIFLRAFLRAQRALLSPMAVTKALREK